MRDSVVVSGLMMAMATGVVVGGGCLEVRGGHAVEADTREDTAGPSDSADPEGTVGVEVADTTLPDTDLCAGQTCDDGDPCTDDRCNQSTGQCEHGGLAAGAALPPEPFECHAVADCDDHNPCTFDECAAAQCADGGWCTHAWLSSCSVGCAAGCDDHDPCTDDACIGANCEHAVLPECDPQCTSDGLLPVRNAWLMPWGSFVKALGTVQMGRSAACTDDGLCNCWGFPVLVGFMSELAIYALNQDEPVMSCRSHDALQDAIATDVSCEPMAVGVDYRVWGTGGGPAPSANAGDAEAKPAPTRIEGIAVDGFCLDSSGLALTGRYEMFFERWGQTATLMAEIAIDEPGWQFLRVKGALCENCPTIETLSVLEVLDNGIRFKFDARFDHLERAVVVRLASVGNTLTGRWVLDNYAAGPMFTLSGPAAGDDAGAARSNESDASVPASGASSGMQDPYYAGGTLRLVRLPGDAPRSPCEWIP